MSPFKANYWSCPFTFVIPSSQSKKRLPKYQSWVQEYIFLVSLLLSTYAPICRIRDSAYFFEVILIDI